MNQKTKIVEVISSMGDGGAETLVKNYALLLDKTNFEMQVWTMYKRTNATNYKQLIKNGIILKSVYSNYSKLTRFLKKTIGLIIIPLFFKKNILSFNPHSIHVHMNQLHHFLLLRKYLKNRQLFYTCHNDPDKYFVGLSGKMEKRAVNLFSKGHNFTLIALHEEMKNKLSVMFPKAKIIIIRNGVDFTKFDLKEDKLELRKNLGFPQDCFIVGHIGRFSAQKNHHKLISVFNEIVKKNSKAFLVMVGDGTLKEQIIEEIRSYGLQEKYVQFAHREDIPEILKSLDVFIFPSLYEGLPVSLVEAQVAGVPCIVSDRIISEAILSSTTVQLSLEDSDSEWASIATKVYPSHGISKELQKYNLNDEIRLLENYYKR